MGLFDNTKKNSELLDFFESSTNPGQFYEIRLGKDGILYCTCAGWAHSRKEIKCCAHLHKFTINHEKLVRAKLIERGFGSEVSKYMNAFAQYDGKRK